MSDKMDKADIYVTDLNNVTLPQLRMALATAFKAGEDQVLAHVDWRRADEYAIRMTEHLEVSSHGRGSLEELKLPVMEEFNLEHLRRVRERVAYSTDIQDVRENRALVEIYLIIDALVYGGYEIRKSK